MPIHRVTEGDTIVSLADRYGLLPDAIWDHADNADLRELREHPNILQPGDEVFVPEKETKREDGETDLVHRFRRLGSTVRLRIRLIEENGEPRTNLPYQLDVGTHSYDGRTDLDGRLDHPVPISEQEGVLQVGDPVSETYALAIGHLDPLEETRGIQGRLLNLGFFRDRYEVDGRSGPETEAAVRAFQERHDLPVTGEVDDETRSEMGDLHGC